MSYQEAKKIIELLISAMLLKEKDRNVAMDLLMDAEYDED